ncbi:MAG: PAS domain S-box protein [Syntrophales bacterium]
MQDKSKTKQELIQELVPLRQRIAEYEQTELQRKQTEDALRESEYVFRLLFEKSGDSSLLIEKGRFIDCNEAVLKILGCSDKSALINLLPTDISPERQPDCELSSEKAARMIEIANNEGSNRFEWVHKKFDGAEVCLDVVLTPIKMNGRKLIYTTWRDSTAQKKAEEALKKSERRLADIIDFLPDATCVFDVRGKVITWNRAMEEMTGVSKNDMLGQGDRAHTIPFYGERRKCLLDLIDGSDKDIEAKYQHVRREGSIIHGEAFAPTLYGGRGAHIRMTGTPLCDTDGNRVGAIESIRDITRSKVIEDQLRQANKMEALGTLAAGIAHDFNNILGGMIGYTEMSLLHIGTGNSLLKRYLEQIRSGIHRATDLVKQILTFSRQKDQEMRPVRVTPLLEETLKLIQAAIPSSIEIIYTVAANRDLILADPTSIHRILMNLCSNAAHAMREKGGILRIEIVNLYLDEDNKIAADVKAGWHLRMTVGDNGQGIDAAIIDRIFDPFFTTKKTGEGTGLGLAVVHGIVKNLGGAIIARSSPEEETVFEIYLPLVEGKDEIINNDLEKTYIGGKERILFVDDEDTMTQIAEDMLSKMGYDIWATTSSVAALKSFRLQPDHFDIVITDQAMPNMTGMVLSEELLKIRPDLPIILCTGFSEIITPARLEAIGIGGFIMKPFTMADLDATIRKVLLMNT